MSAGFTAVPESFPVAADTLRRVAAGVVEAWAPVREQTLAVHYGRGDDVLSPLVQLTLSSAADLVGRSVATTAVHLTEAADALEQMGATYAATDEGVQRQLDALDGAAS